MNRALTPKPCGAAIMITLLALLMLASLIVLATVKNVKTQTMIMRNQQHLSQAFEASEAGLEFGFTYLKENHQTLLKEIKGYAPSLIHFDNDDNTSYDVSYTHTTINDVNVISINSKGSSDSGLVKQTIHEKIAQSPFSSITPPASLVTLGNVSLGGNVLISNTINDATILSGGSISLSGSASTQARNNISSDRTTTDTDISAHNADYASLSNNEFFAKLLGTNKSNTKARAEITLNYDSNQNLSSLLGSGAYNGKSIWINQTSGTASLSGNATIGSTEKPVFIVINGDFKANGNTEIFGILYITQDWLNSGGGNLTIHGAVMVEGNVSGTGTPNIDYDINVIKNALSIAKFIKIPGSWRDF